MLKMHKSSACINKYVPSLVIITYLDVISARSRIIDLSAL